MKFCLAFLVPALAFAATWPDNFAGFQRISASVVTPKSDRPIWDEYGLQQAETAEYQGEGTKFTATAYRFQDSTGGMAAFQWQRPPQGKPSPLAKLAVETPDSLLLAHGNYLLRFHGYKPKAADLVAFLGSVKNVDSTPLPALPNYLPDDYRVANSERYILGPASLARFIPGIAPSVAAFHMGAEAQLGTFQGPGGETRMAIFNYPTPQIARQRLEEFQKLPGLMAKRSGPLVAVIMSPPNPDFAEKLLALVRYQAAVTLSERVPTRRDNIGDLIINVFVLIGILLVFSLVVGLAFGGFRFLFRRAPIEPMVQLHLRDRDWPLG